MKKTVFLILSALMAVACGGPEKPKKLLSQQEMENILYDMSMLQAIRSFTPQTLIDNNIEPEEYIYKKYKIDSLTLAQNQVYYASDLEKSKKLQEAITSRLNADKEKVTGKKNNDKSKNNTSGNTKTTGTNFTPEQKEAMKRKRDSVRDAAQRKLHQAPLNTISHQ